MEKEIRSFNSYDLLKLLALATMTIDHLGYYLLPDVLVLRDIGRIAAPIFCFLVGFNRRYAFRWSLLAIALLMTMADGFISDRWFPQNILWTILLVRILLQRMSLAPSIAMLAGTTLAALVWLPFSHIVVEYGSAAFLCALWGKCAREQHVATPWIGAASMVLMLLLSGVFFQWEWTVLVPQGLLLFVVWLGLRDFKLRPIPINMRAPQWLSRHALGYYAAHKILLMTLAAWLR